MGKHTEYEKRLIAYYLDVIAKEKEAPALTGGVKSSSPVNTTAVGNGVQLGKQASSSVTLSSSPPGLQHSSSTWNGNHPNQNPYQQHNGSVSQFSSSSQAYQEGRSASSTVAKSSSSTSVYSNGKSSESNSKSSSSKQAVTNAYGAKSKNGGHPESTDYHHNNIHSSSTTEAVSQQQYSENGRRKANSTNSNNSSKESVRRQPLLKLPSLKGNASSLTARGGGGGGRSVQAHQGMQEKHSEIGVYGGTLGKDRGGFRRGRGSYRGPFLRPRPPAPVVSLSLPTPNMSTGNGGSRGSNHGWATIPATRQVYAMYSGPASRGGGVGDSSIRQQNRFRRGFGNRNYYN